MDNLVKTIQDSDWAERTKKNRISLIKNLKDNIEPDSNNYNFLKNFNIVSKFILNSSKNPNSLKTKILTIKSILKLADDRSSEKYDKLANSLIEASDESRGNNSITDDSKWITYNEMLNIPNVIANDIIFIYNKLFLSSDEIDNLKTIFAKYKYLRMITNFIIAVLYCRQAPVRTDWCTVQFKPSKTDNWYDMNKNIINFNDFKNVKKMGKMSWSIINPVKQYLKEYISILNYIIDNPTNLIYMIGSKTYKKFTRDNFAIYMARLLKKYTDKNISINTLRHVYESHITSNPNYNRLSINDKKELHSRLLHSSATAQDYNKIENPISLNEFELLQND